MISVGIHPPKTPVTRGSMGTAKATLPNVCKMPGPPAPFVPSPLPNTAKSGLSPKDFSTTVTIEGNAVAIRGATFESFGDMASKGTGGGLLSANTHGPAKFITPGSMTVKIEGKSVHLLSEPMLNNCGPGGSPPNTGATMQGLDQADIDKWDQRLQQYVNECDESENAKWNDEHPKGPRNDDCGANAGVGNFTSGPQAGEPIPVQVELGRLKERCVYDKMGAKDGVPRSNAKGSVTVQQRFGPSGAPNPSAWGGSIVPDVVYHSAEGALSAVRDLKFPCPSGAGREGRWSKGQEDKYFKAFKIVPQLIFPV